MQTSSQSEQKTNVQWQSYPASNIVIESSPKVIDLAVPLDCSKMDVCVNGMKRNAQCMCKIPPRCTDTCSFDTQMINFGNWKSCWDHPEYLIQTNCWMTSKPRQIGHGIK